MYNVSHNGKLIASLSTLDKAEAFAVARKQLFPSESYTISYATSR